MSDFEVEISGQDGAYRATVRSAAGEAGPTLLAFPFDEHALERQLEPLGQNLGRENYRDAGVPADRPMGGAALPVATHDPALAVPTGSRHSRRRPRRAPRPTRRPGRVRPRLGDHRSGGGATGVRPARSRTGVEPPTG